MAITTGIQSKSAISAIALLDRREILKKAVDVQNEEGLTDILQLAGRMKETTQPIFHDYAEDPLFSFLDTTGGTVTGSGTGTVTCAVTLASSGKAIVGDVCLFPQGDKVGQISAITTASGIDTITWKAVDGGTIALTAGDKVTPAWVSVGENSTAPKNRKFGWTKYFNLIQHYRDVNEITDVQLVSDIELEFEGQNYVWNHDIANKFMRFKAGINASFILGRQSATQYSDANPALVDPVNGGAEQATMGLNQYLSTYGVVGNTATLGTANLADFEAYLNLLVASRSPKSHVAYGASKALAKVSNCLKGLNSSGATYGKLSLDGKELDFNAEKLDYMGFDIQFTVLPIMDHPILMGNSQAVKSLFFIPSAKVPTRDGGLEDRLSVRYMKNPIKAGFGNDIYAEWDSGAMARGGAIGDGAYRRTNWLSLQGLQVLGAPQMGKWQVLA